MIRWLTAGFVFALALLQPIWHGWSAWPIGLALLLLLPLPWIIAGSHRAGCAASLMALPFFVHGVTEAVVDPTLRLMALLETGFCTGLFVSLVLWTVSRRQGP